MAEFEFKVGGMACDGCANAVKRAVLNVASDAIVTVNLAEKRVQVQSEAAKDMISAAIAKAGYEILG